MSHSVSPLGSLSSPSPSPPPDPIESELSELTDDDDNDEPDNSDNDQPPPRSRKTTSSSSSVNSRRRQRRRRQSIPASRSANPPNSKRKKRGGLVPAPMWDWAYKNPSGSPSATPAPPPLSTPNNTTAPLPPLDPDSDRTSRPPFKLKQPSPTPDPEEEEEEELPTPPRAMEEEEGEDADSRKDRPQDRKSSRHTLFRGPIDYHKLVGRSKRGLRVRARNTWHQNNQMMKSMWEKGEKVWDPEAPTSDEDAAPAERRLHPSSDSSNSEDDDMDVDDPEDQASTPPHQSPTRPSLNTNLKPTSPPTTSTADQVPGVPSVPPSIRASVDPTVSPPDEDGPPPASLELDEDLDRDPDADTPEYDDHPPPLDGDLEADPDEDEDAQPDEPSQPASPTPLAEPEPEPEPEDEDPDLQPAHRAEALDVLATIELKFALLRERVYVEKMEGLAWEETLVCDGTHPELHHVQSELAKRRDKRLMLASKKRTYEIDAVMRKKREEETWCWEGWDIARTELQTEMIAETNRKRRKLERDRRTLERPPGARRIPGAILNPPPAPTLRQIANTFPLPSHLSHLVANKKLSKAYPNLDGLGGVMSHPDLSTLSPHDIAADLEFLFQHRRMGYGFGMGFGPPIGIPMGVGVGYNGASPGFGPFGGPTPAVGFGVNGLGIGIGATEGYPPNQGPGVSLAAPSAPSQNMSNPPGSVPGPGIANGDGPPFSQPAMGVFQGPPSIGTGPAYPLGPGGSGTNIVIGPGGTTSTPVTGLGGGRIQRPPSFVERDLQRERERELIQREAQERELTPRDRDLAPQRAGGMDWSSGDTRRREERERIERTERDRERERFQVQPVVPTPVHRHLHQHQHPHSHSHTHQPQQPPHQLHPVHANQSHSHQHSQHSQHHHPHGQHPHQHTQHQHGTSHAPPHHHVGQHHHRHHHHVLHIHHSSTPGSGANSSRDEMKLGGSSVPGSRPSSTHPLPPSHNFDERERERERDRPIATPFVLGPSHQHGWTPGPGDPGTGSGVLSQLPRPLTTSPPRVAQSVTSPSISALNASLPSSSTSTGPFPKPSPALPKLGMPPLGYSPRLAGPGVVPPTGPGVPGVLSATSGGPGVTPSGILTSGPGVPPGPGIAPAPATGPGEGNGPSSSLFSTHRTTTPLIPYNVPPPVVAVSAQKIGVDGP